MLYNANITVFNSSLQPTVTKVSERTQTQLQNDINTAITNAGSTFHNIQIIIMREQE